jgi:hypothetical protein
MPVEPPKFTYSENAAIMHSHFSSRLIRTHGTLTARFPRTTLAAVATALALAACEAETLKPQLEPTSALEARVKPKPERTFKVPNSIDDSGKKDVTDDLLEFIASVPDNSVIEFKSGARYRIEFPLELVERHGLTFEGNGAVFFATEIVPYGATREGLDKRNRTRQQFRLVGGSDYVFRNLTIKGAHPNGGLDDFAYVSVIEAQHGLDVHGVQGLELDNVTITDVYGDFVYLTHRGMVRGTIGEWASDIHIHDSRFERNGRQGIAITGARRVLFENNYMGDVRRAHIDLEPNGGRDGAQDLVLRRNVFGPGRLYFLASAGGPAPIEDVTVEENRFVGGKSMTVQIKPPARGIRRNFTFRNNISDSSFGSNEALMSFYRTDGITVRGNRNALNAGRQMTAVYAQGSCNIDVQGNTFQNADRLTEVVGTCSRSMAAQSSEDETGWDQDTLEDEG